MGQQTTLVFTYGTLKKGFPNHVLLRRLMDSGDARFVGSCRTLHPYPLVCGPFRVPFLLHLPGSGHRVRGELYSVSPHALSLLDDLEGTSLGHYQRLPLLIDPGNDASPAPAQAYFAHPSFASDMWRKSGYEASPDYTTEEAFGYVKRSDRPPNVSFLDHIRSFLSN